jgi:hypothetical protein
MVLAVRRIAGRHKNQVGGVSSRKRGLFRKETIMRSLQHSDPRRGAESLVTEHDDLDAAIQALVESDLHDDLMITRLKKRKLQLKDEIAALAPQAAAS